MEVPDELRNMARKMADVKDGDSLTPMEIMSMAAMCYTIECGACPSAQVFIEEMPANVFIVTCQIMKRFGEKDPGIFERQPMADALLTAVSQDLLNRNLDGTRKEQWADTIGDD
jgi:hypothetical protein